MDLLAEEFLLRIRKGERPTIEDYASRNADLADEIRGFFTTLLIVEDLGKSSRDGLGLDRATDSLEADDGIPEEIPPSSGLKQVGEYRILREIGRGGMGIVYEAVQESLGRRVAIKVLPFHSLLGAKHLERFRQEARAAARLTHSNIVPVFGVGEHLGLHYFVMQYIPGKGLDEVIEEVRRIRAEGREGAANGSKSDLGTGGRQRYYHNIARIVREAASALHHAHCEGILHRDVKPSNLLLDPTGQVWLVDFGLAKGEGSDDLTRSGDFVGTLRYMAPERFKGWSDPRSDVYSLGLTLFELLALRPAFLDSDRGLLLSKLESEEPPALRRLDRGIPRDLETIVLKASAKEPLQRYASADAMAQDLDRYLRGEPVEAQRSTALGRLTRWLARNPILSGLGSLVVLLLIVVALISSRSAMRLKLERDLGRDNLRESYLAQARALRVSRRSGQRFGALDAIVKAARIGRGPELCAEAAAALALEDARVIKSWEKTRAETAWFDPELRRIATASRNGEVVVRSLADDRVLARLPGLDHDVPYTQAVFHPNPKYLAVRHHRDEVFDRWTIWDLEREVAVMRVADCVASGSIGFDPRDGALVVPARDGMLRTIEIPTGRVSIEHRLPFDLLNVAIHPGGELIAVGVLGGNECHLVDRRFGRILRTYTHGGIPFSIAWDPGGRFLAVACSDFRSYLWDAETGVLRWVQKGHEAEATQATFHPRGDFFLTGGWDDKIHAWDTWSGRDLFVLSRCIPSFSRDGNTASVVSDYGYDLVEIASRPTAFVLYGHETSNEKHPHMVALAPGGRLAASCGWDGVAIWDLITRREVAHLPVGRVLSVGFDPQGGHLMTSGHDGLLRWPIRSRLAEGRRRVVIGPPASVRPFTDLWRHAVGDGGRRVAFLHGRTHGHVLSLDGPAAETRLEDASPVEHVAISPDGRWVAGTSKNLEHVLLWDGTTGEKVETLESRYGYPAFDPTGQYLVVGTHAAYVFFRTKDWEVAHRLPRAPGLESPGPIAFDPKGSVMALAESGDRVSLVEIETWKRLAELEAPDPRILNGLSLDLDAGLLAGSSRSQRCYVWDLRSIERQLAQAGIPWGLSVGHGPTSEPLHVDAIAPGAILGLEEGLEDPRSPPLFRKHLRARFLPILDSYGDLDAALAEPEPLVSDGAIWKYFRGVVEPSGGLEWTSVEFADDTWARGDGGFAGRGAGDGETGTVLEDQSRSFTTLYLRRAFDLDHVASIDRVFLALRFDGGFIAYLNGKEIARRNAGGLDERMRTDSVATGADGVRRREFLGAVDASLLVEGRNVLAVQSLAGGRSASIFVYPVLAAVLSPDARMDGERTAATTDGTGGASDRALAAYRAGRILHRQGKHEDALAEYRRAVALDPASPEPIVRSVECLRERGEPEAAELLARGALERGGFLDDGAIWAAWALVTFRDLHRSLADVLAGWPSAQAAASRHGAELRSTVVDLAERGAVRINCGGARFESGDGKVWSGDRSYLGGRSTYDEPRVAPSPELPPTEEAPLYWSARSFPGDRQIRPAYRVPLPAGRYRVTLEFVEIRSKMPGSRIFGVTLERQMVLERHEPLRAGFATVESKSFEVEVRDGFLDLDFIAEQGDPSIAAIAIERSE